MSTYAKPLPVTTPWSEPFWQAAREHRLVIQRCRDCDRAILYPKLFCPHCHGSNLDWFEVSGEGEVYSYTIVTAHPPSTFLDSIPYGVAIVRLREGVQMMTNIVGCEPDEVRCGMPVAVHFDDVDERFTLVKFRPRDS